MSDDIQHRISAEGADPLLFAGVNEGNLQELQRTLGVRISFRGDSVTVAGTAEQVEREAAGLREAAVRKAGDDPKARRKPGPLP